MNPDDEIKDWIDILRGVRLVSIWKWVLPMFIRDLRLQNLTANPLEDLTGQLTHVAGILLWRGNNTFVQVSKKGMEIPVIADTTVLTTGDGQKLFCIPRMFNGMKLVDAQAFVTTVSSSGLPTVQLRNVTQAYDILTTKITIDVSEKTSYSAATPSVIDTTKDAATTGDIWAIDVDVSGTSTQGLGVVLEFA